MSAFATSLWMTVMLTVVVACGYGLLRWLALRAGGPPSLRRAVLVSYAARVLLAAGLYAISYWRWPILRPLQAQPGFWSFGLDSFVYHHYGTQIAEAWRYGTELPKVEFGFDFFAVIGGLYWLLGAFPLYPMVLNSFLAAVNGLLVYRIGRRLFDQRAALWSSLLVAFWPSTFLWTTQLLKEALSWFLVLSVLLLAIEAIVAIKATRPSAIRCVWSALLLGSAVVALTRLRFYVGSTLSLAAVAVLVPASVPAFFRRRAGQGVQYLGIVVVVIASTLFARMLNPFQLLSPPNPHRAHYRLAFNHWEAEQFERATVEFTRAIAAEPAYEDAYLGLGAVLISQARWEEAIATYKRYLEVTAFKTENVRAIHPIIVRLSLSLADQRFVAREMDAAAAAYEQAMTFDPTLVEAVAGLSLTLARRQLFEQAFEMSRRASDMARTPEERKRVARVVARVYAEKGFIEFASAQAAGDDDQVKAAHLEAVFAAFEPAIGLDPALEFEFLHVLGTGRYLYLLPRMSVKAREWYQSLGAEPQQARQRVPETLEAVLPARPSESILDMALKLLPTRRGNLHEAQTVSHGKAHGFHRLDDQVLVVASELSPRALGIRREGFVSSGGYSLMDSWARIFTLPALVRYLPRALVVGLCAPFPWQWFDMKGSTGVMRLFAGVEVALVYLLVLPILWGVWSLLRGRRAEGLFVLAFIFLTAVPVSLVVANLGTLFRLRLLYLLPLLLVAGGGASEAYGRLRRRRTDEPKERREVGEVTAGGVGSDIAVELPIGFSPATSLRPDDLGKGRR